MIRKFLDLGNKYAEQSDWKDFALTKFCLCAMGILIGVSLPRKCKRPALAIAGIIFGSTYFILMRKVFGILFDKNQD